MELRVEPNRFELILGICPNAAASGYIPVRIKYSETEEEIKNSYTKDLALNTMRAYGKTLMKVEDFARLDLSALDGRVYMTFASKKEEFERNKDTTTMANELRKKSFRSKFKIKGYRGGGYVLNNLDIDKLIGYEVLDRMICEAAFKGDMKKALRVAEISEDNIKKNEIPIADKINYLEVSDAGEKVNVKFKVFFCDSDEEDNFNMKRFEKFLTEFKGKFTIEEGDIYTDNDGEEKKSKIFTFEKTGDILKDLLDFKVKDEVLIEGFKLELEKSRGENGRKR